jgi:hypothetical protein
MHFLCISSTHVLAAAEYVVVAVVVLALMAVVVMTASYCQLSVCRGAEPEGLTVWTAVVAA